MPGHWIFTICAPIWLLGSSLLAESYYVAPKSYSTTRDPDPPRYTTAADETGIDFLANASWLDVGLDYRYRYEYRDDDIRRPVAGLDDPMLHRTRAYFGVHDLLDPFRFAVEMQDARRYHSQFPRDNRDWNPFEIIRLYGELYFEDLLGRDAQGNARPLSLRYGIHNFEFLDRRLIGNNQWRNTANAFQGFHGSLGQEHSDWQVDLLAVQPMERDIDRVDRPAEQLWMYGVIGHWRGWSQFVTLEPYYLALHQSPYSRVAGRTLHNYGLRAYGIVGETGFDYDTSFNLQAGRNGAEDTEAWAATAELGYSFDLPWQPRFSVFYGQATGDENPADQEDNRFFRFFGFGRPWSANDYIVFDNIRTPKLRLECAPAKSVRVDLGYSWYWLDSATDRFANAESQRDPDGAGGRFIGHEFDIRARFSLGAMTEITLGYAHFLPGGFIERNVRPGDTDFGYIEFTRRFF